MPWNTQSGACPLWYPDQIRAFPKVGVLIPSARALAKKEPRYTKIHKSTMEGPPRAPRRLMALRAAGLQRRTKAKLSKLRLVNCTRVRADSSRWYAGVFQNVKGRCEVMVLCMLQPSRSAPFGHVLRTRKPSSRISTGYDCSTEGRTGLTGASGAGLGPRPFARIPPACRR